MLKIRRILFPTDFSRCAETAQTHAVLWARAHGAELHVIHARVYAEEQGHDPSQFFPADPDELHVKLEENAQAELEGMRRRISEEGVPVVLAQPRGIASAPTILEYADEHDIDLIALGTHGRRGLRRLVLGSVATEVVRHATCPVLTVRECEGQSASWLPRRILVPIDFSEPSETGVSHARALADTAQARIDLLHVIETPRVPDVYGMTEYTITGDFEKVVDRAKEGLAAWIEQLGGPERATAHVEQGHAAHQIVEFAERNHTEAIVIATHGLTGFERLLMGSIAEQVVQRAGCPVLTVKPFGHSLTD